MFEYTNSFKTLHSNLVIFKSGLLQKSQSCTASLHSNLVIFKLLCTCKHLGFAILYIPIWLYSNGPRYTAFVKQTTFTFQSGYIQINMEWALGKGFVPLHSNLVIFKCRQFLINYIVNPSLHAKLVIFK